MKCRISKKQIAGVAIGVFLSLSSTISGLAQDSGWHKDEGTKRWWYSLPDGTFISLPGNGLTETETVLQSAILLILTDTYIPT